MSYLLDTNVISELPRRRPSSAVLRWFETVRHERLYLSVITVGEIRKGIEMLPAGARKQKLNVWFEHELSEFVGHKLLSVDRAIADRWGRLLAESLRSVSVIDALLAATALVHNLRLVTRNMDHYKFRGLMIVNPWT